MNNLRALREMLGMKQSVLAREVGLKNQVSISEWETGRKGLSLENAIMFAKYFNVSVGCVAGVEPIPEGYPDSYFQPVSYEQLLRDQRQAAIEGRLGSQIAADVEKPFRQKKPPFTKEQIAYLDEMIDNRTQTLKTDVANEVVERLREVSSLLRETGDA